jgi:hypothetical protein
LTNGADFTKSLNPRAACGRCNVRGRADNEVRLVFGKHGSRLMPGRYDRRDAITARTTKFLWMERGMHSSQNNEMILLLGAHLLPLAISEYHRCCGHGGLKSCGESSPFSRRERHAKMCLLPSIHELADFGQNPDPDRDASRCHRSQLRLHRGRRLLRREPRPVRPLARRPGASIVQGPEA